MLEREVGHDLVESARKRSKRGEEKSETNALLDKNMSLDEELTVEMEEFAFMRERMVALRKKNNAFHSNMIDKLQKMGEKYPAYEKGAANSGTDNAHPEVSKKEDGEEIFYKPPFLGHIKGGD